MRRRSWRLELRAGSSGRGCGRCHAIASSCVVCCACSGSSRGGRSGCPWLGVRLLALASLLEPRAGVCELSGAAAAVRRGLSYSSGRFLGSGVARRCGSIRSGRRGVVRSSFLALLAWTSWPVVSPLAAEVSELAVAASVEAVFLLFLVFLAGVADVSVAAAWSAGRGRVGRCFAFFFFFLVVVVAV